MNGVTREAGSYRLSLATTIYSVDAIKKTAYKFADRTSIIISPESGTTVSVIFNFKEEDPTNSSERVIADFCNELLDQDLREIIKRETGPLRNLILAHAFSKTTLADQS
jgi:His-Xaa-Ser system protein HxsD